MKDPELNIVTGACGYTGKYITRQLLSLGKRVRSLTGHPDRNGAFEKEIEVAPFHFDQPELLIENLKGATTLYNTYWIRFAHKDMTFEKAIENTETLVQCAEKAGVQRIVHISITNPSEDSKLPYFKGKAQLEKAITQSSLSYAIVRPTVIFGKEDILINNIAWCLRKFPAFAIPGNGDYQVQPIYVEDYAKIAVDAGHRKENEIIDAVGPDTFTFDQLVRIIAEKVGSKARIIHQSPGMTFFLSKVISYMVHDIILTQDEVKGLMENLLVSSDPPLGTTHFADWLGENEEHIGKGYSSELNRHYR